MIVAIDGECALGATETEHLWWMWGEGVRVALSCYDSIATAHHYHLTCKQRWLLGSEDESTTS